MKKWAMAAALLLAGFGTAVMGADFNGDGTGDIAVFRASSGLWLVRGVTRVYFGATGDAPVPGDYSGSGTDQAAIFRSASGLWIARGVTRAYFGAGDQAQPGDYNGDGKYDIGIFRGSSGLWAAKGVTRAYFGSSADTAISPGKARTSEGGGGLLKTGQTTVYRTGDDGTYQKGAAFSYHTSDPAGNGEIVAIDNVTGLIWAPDGDQAGCNFAGQTDWNSAIDWANNLTFAGYSDWRLPNRRELESLVDSSIFNPAINPTYFPNTRADFYWSGSTYAGDTASAWVVNFTDGYMAIGGKAITFYVRAVRNGQ